MQLSASLFDAMLTSTDFTGKKKFKWAHYPGSLTIPACDDVVNWFVY